jgi:endoglucanase
MVILNCHTSKSQWCCSNKDGDGLWWSREWPEYLFFESVERLAKRYKHNPRVIGMDLRN